MRVDPPASERKPDLEAFDAILLDVGNVMIYDFPVELAYVSCVRREIIRRRLHSSVTVDEILQAIHNPAGLAQKLGSTGTWEEINAIAWKLVSDNWAGLCIPIPGAIETLRRLSYLRLAIVANQPVHTMATLETLGIVNLFEEIVLDSLAGVSKPSTAIYEYAAQRLHAKPESLLMIGDRLDHDIFPAKAVGMKTVWISKFPTDEIIPLPLVSKATKSPFFRAKKTAHSRHAERLHSCSAELFPDYIVNHLTDLMS